MFSAKKKRGVHKTAIIIILLILSVEIQADIYMDLDTRFQSIAQLLGNSDVSERYLVMNGVPVRTKIYLSRLVPDEIIDTVYKRKYQDIVSGRDLANDLSEPIIISNQNIATILSINLNELLNNDGEQNRHLTAIDTSHEENYVVMASKINDNNSRVFELKFNSIFDIAKLLLDNGSDVECNEKLNLERYPSSRRIFCLTEITSDQTKSQTIIYEGQGNKHSRLAHYQNELDSMNYNIDAAGNGSDNDASIFFASNKYSQVTVFTYLSKNKTLDIIQSKF